MGRSCLRDDKDWQKLPWFCPQKLPKLYMNIKNIVKFITLWISVFSWIKIWQKLTLLVHHKKPSGRRPSYSQIEPDEPRFRARSHGCDEFYILSFYIIIRCPNFCILGSLSTCAIFSQYIQTYLFIVSVVLAQIQSFLMEMLSCTLTCLVKLCSSLLQLYP